MDKYKSLAKNTGIFAIGTFSSKILSFIMVFFYSRALTTEQYGVLDIILNSAALLLPVVMLGITNSIIRFGLDDNYLKSDVFTTGLVAVAIGYGILLLAAPLVMLVDDLRQYIFLLYAHILMSALRHICSFFVRADGKSKLFAADGVFSTFMTCLLTIIFLLPLKMNIAGYLSAVILADFSSVIFLSVNGRLFSKINFKKLDLSVTKRMILFALPLMPTSLMWWVVNVSDRYFVKYMVGDSANGLYAVAYKIPTILTLVANIFLDAWQISAVVENKDKSHEKFYSQVFSTFGSAVFVVSSGLILTAKLVTRILLSDSFYDSWRYIPTLIYATIFACFVTFLGNIYLADKRNIATLVTTVIGAVLNLFLNYVLISIYGTNGAAIATLISYFAVFLIRAIDIKRHGRNIHFDFAKLTVNCVVITLQVITMCCELKYWLPIQFLCFVCLCLINFKALVESTKKVLRKQ